MRHGSSSAVRFATRDGEQTGLVHLPHTPPPPGGWPVVTLGHMTTGAGPRSAPSVGHPGHPEWRRMSQGDALCEELLARGVAVLRPDYPGLGSPGPHPYLIGEPLAASMIGMLAARHDLDERLGDRWVAAGHSEGSLAALHTSVAPWPVPLLGIAACAPVTRMDLTIRAATRLPLTPPGFGVLPPLVGLMLLGAATASDDVRRQLGGGLGEAARTRWSHLGERTLTELAARDSWGSIPLSRIAGHDLLAALWEVMRANEVARLRPSVPVRVDWGLYDEVAPAPLTRRLLRGWTAAGVDVVDRRWPTHHSGVMQARHAPRETAAWIVSRLG